MTCWGRSYVAGEGGSLVPRPVPGATGVIQVISSGLHAWHRWNDGRVGFTGDLAHYFVPYSGLNFGFHREPLPHPFLSGAIAHLTGFDGSRWCAVHANGLVTCSYMFSRPLGVPLPVEP
jgi:hypothetical protein